MGKIDVVNKITVYETDGKENLALDMPKLIIKNHWNRREFVVLEFEDKKITVSAKDLQKSIDNATNAH